MSKLAKDFNNLNGVTVNRETLEYLLQRAEKERHALIQRRIVKVLEANPETNKFLIEIKDLIEPFALNGIEMDYFDEDTLNEKFTGGLNGIPQAEIYDFITNLIIEDFENHDKWESGINDNFDGTFLTAYNFSTKKPYRGINQLLLGDMFGIKNLKNPYYLTFKQVEKLGGKIVEGARASDAIFYKIVFKYKDFRTDDRNKFIQHIRSTGEFADEEIFSVVNEHSFGILRIYNVFNGKDIEGIDFDLDVQNKSESETIEICEKIISKYPAPAPKLKFGGKQPFYERNNDYVQMPFKNSFNDVRVYYAVLFHEFVHSTGSANRLNRVKGKKFGDNEYAFEELVAEIGSCFISATCGFYYFTNKNAKAYIKSWRNGIISALKEDNKGIFKSAAFAQKAVDYMLTNVTEADFITTEVMDTKPKKENAQNTKKPANKVSKVPAKSKKTTKSVVRNVRKVEKKEPIEAPLKVDEKEQIALFGVENKAKKNKVTPKLNGLIDGIVTNVIANEILVTEPKKNSISERIKNRPTEFEYFEVLDAEISDFLGDVERKNKDSLVISLTGGQGSGKTRFAFQFMNALAQKYHVGHASIEEHPESKLYYDKVEQYLNETAMQNIEAPEIKTIQELDELIENNDVIVIDSFAKMQEIQKDFEVDKDLRKKYNGKLFLVIFQQTSDGKMRGGSKSQFDADIVLFTEKKEDYRNNYVYADKNRYQDKPIDQLKFNIYSRKLVGTEKIENPDKPKQENNHVFSFQVN